MVCRLFVDEFRLRRALVEVVFLAKALEAKDVPMAPQNYDIFGETMQDVHGELLGILWASSESNRNGPRDILSCDRFTEKRGVLMNGIQLVNITRGKPQQFG